VELDISNGLAARIGRRLCNCGHTQQTYEHSLDTSSNTHPDWKKSYHHNSQKCVHTIITY
ncbi:MAG TPA: hypothetical protein VFI14_00290, partial [Chryseosolibacter sp.]|nr:hypothetical protein [Chryseosolibacter sp.]